MNSLFYEIALKICLINKESFKFVIVFGQVKKAITLETMYRVC